MPLFSADEAKPWRGGAYNVLEEAAEGGERLSTAGLGALVDLLLVLRTAQMLVEPMQGPVLIVAEILSNFERTFVPRPSRRDSVCLAHIVPCPSGWRMSRKMCPSRPKRGHLAKISGLRPKIVTKRLIETLSEAAGRQIQRCEQVSSTAPVQGALDCEVEVLEVCLRQVTFR